MKRWVWLEICVVLIGVKPKGSTIITHYYVPEEIIAYIPSYEAQLHERLASIQGDDEPVVRDNIPRDQQAVGRAIRFLVSGYLTPLDASSHTCTNTLHRLVDLYNLSIALSIESIETAVLDRIDNLDFEALGHGNFLTFARRYHSETGPGTRGASLGRLIKKKLSHLMPHLEQSMIIGQVGYLGGGFERGLGTQMLEVLLEDRAKMRETPGPTTKTEVKKE
jgi:hypothetical protein